MAESERPTGEGSTRRKLRVAVVFGGRSAEHEIAILSARFIVESLDRERFEPLLIGIDKEGRWLLQEEAELLAASRDPRLVRLGTGRPEANLLPHPATEPDRQGQLVVGDGRGLGIDLVFPVLHGPMGEDGCIQGLFALAGVPHVGAGVLGSAVGMDKDVMKRLLADAGLPIVKHVTIRRARWDRARATVLEEALALGFPCFVKPANLGSSVGVSMARDASSLARGIEEAFEFDEKIVVEAGVAGVRELECAVLGNEEPRASRVGEIVVTHPDGFYSYDAKYVDEHGATTRIPADIDREEEARVQELALRTFTALECEGLARVDFFRSAGGEIFVNEINTLPGFTAISMYPKLWEASGVGAKQLVSELCDLALARGARRKHLRTSR
jgi:D-alanine-D-alanine ligase